MINEYYEMKGNRNENKPKKRCVVSAAPSPKATKKFNTDTTREQIEEIITEEYYADGRLIYKTIKYIYPNM